jgi:nitrite reductase/ring-hydroxylating ferredoxin subunit
VSIPDRGDAAVGRAICRADEIPEGGGSGFLIPAGDYPRRIFIVRHRGALFAYDNTCPHAGTPLDWMPDRFFDPSGTLLQCATHGAQFRIADGLCVAGPCAGKRLTPVALEISGDYVVAGEI